MGKRVEKRKQKFDRGGTFGENGNGGNCLVICQGYAMFVFFLEDIENYAGYSCKLAALKEEGMEEKLSISSEGLVEGPQLQTFPKDFFKKRSGGGAKAQAGQKELFNSAASK